MPKAENHHQRKLVLKLLAAALDDLEPDERTLIDALFYKERTERDYAAEIGISHQAVGKPSNNIRIYGYDYKDGKLTVIPEDAEVVRMIFADYLGGMGKNAIMKKLSRLGISTKCGGRWSESTVGSILTNEKFIGDMCLQKGFVTDTSPSTRSRITASYRNTTSRVPTFLFAE